MKTLMTVCSTLACAGGAFVAYEHPEWIRQGAQQWEAWRKSAATAPAETPVARAIDDAKERVVQAASDVREHVAAIESQPVAGKSLDQWFTELSGLEGSTASPAGESPAGGAQDDLQGAARALAGYRSEPTPAASEGLADDPVIEREPARFQTAQQSNGDSELTARPASASRQLPSISLTSHRLGQGPLRTLVVAGLNGEDRSSVAAVGRLAEQLNDQSGVLAEQTFLLVPAANPFGLGAGRRFNERNVDLSRNFPGRRYRSQVEFSGAYPASEVETQQLLGLMFEFQPERVIHVIDDPLSTRILFNRAAGELAGELQRQHQVTVERLDFDRMPGSLEEFADGLFHVPVLVVCLRPHESEGLLTALVTTVEQRSRRSQEAQPETAPVELEPAPAGPVAGPERSVPAKPASAGGYEELPPPPK